MLFSGSVPEVALESPNTSGFLSVLDKLQEHKTLIVTEAIRATSNYAVTTNKKWIIKHLSDFGVVGVTEEFPLSVLQQLLLNVGVLFGTRGSKIGLELFCSLMSLGEVSIDDSKVYVRPSNIILDSIYQGHLTGSNSEDFFYLVGDNDILNPKTSIKIAIKSKYFNGNYPKESEAIKGYITSNVQFWLGFSNTRQEISFQAANDFYYHRLLNKYFV